MLRLTDEVNLCGVVTTNANTAYIYACTVDTDDQDTVREDFSVTKRGYTRIGVLALVALAVTLAGCAALQGAVKTPDVVFRTFSLESVDFEQASVNLFFDVENTNPFAIPVSGYQYTFKIGEHTLLSADDPADMRIPANGTGSLTIPVTLRFSDITNAVQQLVNSDVWPYSVAGTVAVDAGPLSGINIPFSHTGEVPRPVMPDISVQNIGIRSASLLNIGVDVTLNMRNSGSLTYVLDALQGSLSLNGRQLANIGGLESLRLTPGTQTVTIPLDVSTGSALQSILSLLGSGDVEYALNGNAVVKNDLFGALPMNVNTSGSVPLIRK